jgi:cob(I)alamin adenosyltransferase
MTVNLTRIYTKLGDDGETHLGDMSRVPKTHPRIEAYGEIDELNSHLGVARAMDLPEGWASWLTHIQNDLFDLGADLSVPPSDGKDRLRVRAEQVTWLEERCDEVNAALPPLRSFVLPRRQRARRPAPRLPDGLPARRAPELAVQDAIPRSAGTSTGSRTCCSSSRGARTPARGSEPLWEPGRFQ